MTRLTNVLIKSLQSGFHSDGGGLFLDVRDTGKSWVYRYKVGQKQRKMGLGAYPAVSIKEARLKAAEARALRAKRSTLIAAKSLTSPPTRLVA